MRFHNSLSHLIIALLLLIALSVSAQSTLTNRLSYTYYTPQDSQHVVSLLESAQREQQTRITPLYFAREFLAAPYVAHTLEVCDPERLVVNLQSFDCTTLLETSIALWLTYKRGETSFEGYLAQLERIRYQDGKMLGYPSRLHYFSQWIDSNTAQGIVTEITSQYHRTLPQHLALYYMSTKPHLYKILKANPTFIPAIRQAEQRYKGCVVRYIPKRELNHDKDILHCIEEGDIIAFVTKKQGLDTSHLGFATWHNDGKLHLFNASSLRKQVVDEQQSLYEYLLRQPSVIGIRILKFTL